MRTLRYITVFYFMSYFLLISGCSKQLDLSPTDTINENNAYRTINDAQLGANGAYGRYTAYFNDIFLSALLSDEAKLGADNAGQGALTYRYQGNAESGDLQGGYAAYYLMIDQCNRVLTALPNVLANAGEEPRRNILKGQLLALRGIGYYGLLQSFSKNYDPSAKGVPIMLAPDPSARPGHSTMGQVMTRIETDLAEALTLLPAVTPATFTDTVMNSVNIEAYRAKIALYKGDYDNAIRYATIVINSNVRQLASSANFSSIWTEAAYPTIPESLFRIRNATGTTLGGFWTTSGSNQVYVAPSDKLTAVYETGDIRKGAYIGVTSGKPYVKKHESARPAGSGARVVDLKAIRIAEMYLIRAEAYAKQAAPNVALGIADLVTLRTNRFTGAPPALPTITNGTDLLNAVILERYRELCFEGSRFFDLRRNNLAVSRLSSDAAAAWQTLPANDNFFVMPIPFAEIQANPNAIQNPGY